MIIGDDGQQGSTQDWHQAADSAPTVEKHGRRCWSQAVTNGHGEGNRTVVFGPCREATG